MTEPAPAAAAPLAGLSFCLAGPGRVGASLASWAVARGAALAAVAGRRAAPAAELASRLGGRAAAIEELDSAGADLLLLAVPDGAIRAVAELLARRRQAPVALHTAGALGASALAPLAAAGAATGTFHPLKAFPRPLPDPAGAAGTFFALDGAPRARELGERLAAAFGGSAGVVPEEARELYHLAASVAAGGVATLVASAAELARSLDLPAGVVRGYLELARGALCELAHEADRSGAAAPRIERAITGPVARGDFATLRQELDALHRAGEPAARRLALFGRLAVETARLSAGEADARRLEAALEEDGRLDPPPHGC